MLWTNKLLNLRNEVLSKNVRLYNAKTNNPLCQTLEEILVMLWIVAQKPTKVKLLVPSSPEIIIFTDVSKEGVRVTIYLLDGSEIFLVFRTPCRDEIKEATSS